MSQTLTNKPSAIAESNLLRLEAEALFEAAVQEWMLANNAYYVHARSAFDSRWRGSDYTPDDLKIRAAHALLMLRTDEHFLLTHPEATR